MRTAGDNIANVFRVVLNTLVQSNGHAGTILNEGAFIQHDTVIRNNIRSLSLIQRTRLRRAWKELAHHNENNKIPFYEMYSDCGSLDKRAILKPLAIK